MDARPEISVVMAVRNAGAYLAVTVDSILTQEDVDLEFVIVENGSTDSTAGTLDEIARKDRRIRVLRLGPAGLTAALIAGCAAARAPVIARQDAGDVSLPSRLRSQLDLLSRHPGAVLASCGVRFTGPCGEELFSAHAGNGDAVRHSLLTAGADAIRGINHHGSAMFLRAAYLNAGGYRAQFAYAQDLDLWIRLARAGEIVVSPETLYEASISPQSISSLRRAEQESLTTIAVALREAPEEMQAVLLAAAAAVRRVSGEPQPRDLARGCYFIGRALQKRSDARARRYLLQAVKHDPAHLRAWIGLALTALRSAPR